MPENRDVQILNFVTRTFCIFGGRWRTLPMRWRTRWEVRDPVPDKEVRFLMETTSVCNTFLCAFLKLCFICK